MNKKYREIDGVTYVGVLYSPGYGAGWSTWDDPALAVDERVIDWILEHGDVSEHYEREWEIELNRNALDSLQPYLESIGYPCVYTGGATHLQLAWIPKGTTIRINEYDGAESILEIGELDLITL